MMLQSKLNLKNEEKYPIAKIFIMRDWMGLPCLNDTTTKEKLRKEFNIVPADKEEQDDYYYYLECVRQIAGVKQYFDNINLPDNYQFTVKNEDPRRVFIDVFRVQQLMAFNVFVKAYLAKINTYYQQKINAIIDSIEQETFTNWSLPILNPNNKLKFLENINFCVMISILKQKYEKKNCTLLI